MLLYHLIHGAEEAPVICFFRLDYTYLLFIIDLFPVSLFPDSWVEVRQGGTDTPSGAAKPLPYSLYTEQMEKLLLEAQRESSRSSRSTSCHDSNASSQARYVIHWYMVLPGSLVATYFSIV